MIPRILFPVCSILLVALFQSGLAFVMIQTKIQISKMSMGIQSGDTDGLIDFFQDWIAKESLETLLPRASLKLVLEELMSDRELWRRSEGNFNDFVTDFETKLRIEKRPLQTILGEATTKDILKAVEKVDMYDPQTVKAFLGSSAVELMIGGILYEAIFEFTKKADVFGGIVNSLPIIGPIRQQITIEVKKSLDKILGPQVKVFLGSYNRVAVEQMVTFILSKENAASLSKANKNLVLSLLSRPVNSLLPTPAISKSIREQLWKSIVDYPIQDAKKLVDIIYDFIGERKVNEYVDFNEISKTSPESKKIASNVVNRFITAYEQRK